jgi:acyl-[acyl-carrier-protein]-phospholipid O-acyltransferase / long-chain-fatty-acid--[acyl-carrier-protein] ligase
MFQAFIRLLLRLLYGVRVSGRLAEAGKTIIVANHQSFLDAALLWAWLPRNVLYIVHTQVMEERLFRFLLRFAEYVVIDTTRPMAMKQVAELIDSGRPVVIFPEGRVTITGAMMKIYDGPAFLAARTGATVAPVTIDGAIHARGFTRMNRDFPRRFFPRITMIFHPGEQIPMPEAPNAKLRRRKASEQLRRILQRAWLHARPSRSLHDAFLDSVDLHGRGRDLATDAGGTKFTYGGLLRASLALGRLVGKFTRENEVVGVMMPNAAATLGLFLGLLGTRRVPAMLNFTSGVEGLNSAIRAAEIKTVLTSRAFLERAGLQPTVDRLEGVRIVLLEDLRATLTLADKLWLILYALRFPRAATLRTRPEDPAVVLFTSGSEGKPKGVVLAHRSILANIDQVLTIMDVSPADKILSAMPVFHSFGLTAGFMLPVIGGLRVFLYPTPLHYSIIPELFYDRDCTVMFATPTFLKHYARRAHPYDFRRVRLLLAGAEKLTDEVRLTYLEKFGVRVLEGYGATECAPVIAVNTPMKCKAGSVGELLPGIEAQLEPVPGIDRGGLLHVRGPNVMLGYWRESAPRTLEPPESGFGPGWYATGDLAEFDADGFLTLLGRVKRFAKVAGEMVSLEVVEKLAEAASPASLHAAITRPDERRGEMIIICTQDATLDRARLQEAARNLGAPELAIPRRVIHIPKIPLLGNGKKDYPQLQTLVEELIATTR